MPAFVSPPNPAPPIPVVVQDSTPPLPPPFRHRLTEPILKYLEGRGMLASLEAKEALGRITLLLLMAMVAGVLIFAGWLLLATALVGWITVKFHWHWFAAAAATGGAHVLLAAILVGFAWWRFSKTLWFYETLNELKKDRAWLKGSTAKN